MHEKGKWILGSFARLVIVLCLLLFVPMMAFIQVQFLGGSLRDWLAPTPMLSFAGLVIGFVVVTWQLERQHRNAIEAHRLQAQNQLKLEIYKELIHRMELAGGPLAELANMPGFYVMELKQRMKLSIRILESRFSFTSLQALDKQCSEAVTGLMTVLEDYEIALPRFDRFSTKLGHHHQSLSRPFQDFTLIASSFSDPKSLMVPWPPTGDDIEKLESLGKLIAEEAWNLTCVIEDLRKASQNFLVGNLFLGNRAEYRKPGDHTVEVLSGPDPEIDRA